MISIRSIRSVLPLAVAGAFLWMTGALAQQAAPAQAPKPAAPKPAAAKPAAKPAAPKPSTPTSAQATPASNPTAQATLLGQFGDWSAYTAAPGGRKVCFALAKPASSQDNPPNRRTAANTVYMFISTRPSEKVRDELSILVTGYAFKPSAEASLAIGSASFPMYAQNDGAWVKNPADEARLIDTMRKGGDAVVKGTTSRGTQTTDTFSLRGFDQAVKRAAQECP
jgi:hypothetical protein